MSHVSWPASVDWYDITLATPAENVALDEILLQQVEQNPARAILRTWEPLIPFVVVGRSNQVELEVDTKECHREGIRIFRRVSGGGAVVAGPGCLAYALALPLTEDVKSQGVASATRLLMQTVADGLSSVLPGVEVRGTSDLVVNDRKFSGNSQRWLRQAFLHHGTILYDFDLTLIQRLLKPPTRQPDYRSGRSHADFVANVPVARDVLLARLVATWNGQPKTCPAETVAQSHLLAESRYERDEWNFER